MIQAKVINLLPGMSLGQAINPIVDNSFINYVQNNFQQNYERLQSFGMGLTQSMQQLFNYFTSDTYINKAREIGSQTGLKNDVAIYAVDCTTVTNAGFTMAGYIMANPAVWDMYSKFRIDGYNDMFKQQDIEETNPYRKIEYMDVMDSMVQFKDDGYEVSYYSYNGDELTLREKLTVLDAWDCAEFLIEQGVDPTSGEEL